MKNIATQQTRITAKRDAVTSQKGLLTKEQIQVSDNTVPLTEDISPILDLLYAMYLENQNQTTTEDYKEAI